jgi:carbonic anhydrase
MALTTALLLTLASGNGHAAGAGGWSYEGERGPEHWGDLSPDYHACGMGRMQSPIDLAAANVEADVSITVEYKPVPLTILHNGHTIQFNVENGSRILVGDIPYELLQVHFHTPSEHVVAGQPYPLEAHFVHRSPEGKLAVVGVFFLEGDSNYALADMFAYTPQNKTKAETHFDLIVSPAAILPPVPHFYRYMGSLTTPPCTEGVNWFVVSTPSYASKVQIETLRQAMGENARPAQPLNGRLVIEPR